MSQTFPTSRCEDVKLSRVQIIPLIFIDIFATKFLTYGPMANQEKDGYTIFRSQTRVKKYLRKICLSILYEDEHIVCDDDAITIYWYYFPIGSKRIPYNAILHIHEESMGFLTGAGRIWGMGLSPHWFHLDWRRPSKTRCIVIDDGNWIKSVITPDHHDPVMRILQEKVNQQPLSGS